VQPAPAQEPDSEHAGPRHGRRGLARGLLVTLVAVLIVGLGTASALVLRADHALERVDIRAAGGVSPAPAEAEEDGDAEVDAAVDALDDVVHVLLVGSDNREVLTREERFELGTGEAEGERTETIMLLRLDPTREGVALLSMPRDLLVTRCDGTRGRINAAYAIGEREGIGGGACLVQTVRELTGIPIDHFVKVDFRGFIDIVDTVGGLTMHLDEPLSDERAHLDLPAGCVTLDSAQALAFVRARHIDSDFGRIARQQRFLREMANEISSVGVVANVPRLFSLVDSVARSLEVDEDLSLLRMRQVAAAARELSHDRIVSFTVPAQFRQEGGNAFLVVDEPAAEALFTGFANGMLLDPLPEPAAPPADDGAHPPPADETAGTQEDATQTTQDTRDPEDPEDPEPQPAPTPTDGSAYAGAQGSEMDC
jgi:LCP family protein required for cell wall assembly